jgi:hypothetical protein
LAVVQQATDRFFLLLPQQSERLVVARDGCVAVRRVEEGRRLLFLRGASRD